MFWFNKDRTQWEFDLSIYNYSISFECLIESWWCHRNTGQNWSTIETIVINHRQHCHHHWFTTERSFEIYKENTSTTPCSRLQMNQFKSSHVYITSHHITSHHITSHHITYIHYITVTPFQMPLTPKVTSGASTITCYTKYIPPAQHVG